MTASYTAPTGAAEAEIREKGSVFLAVIAPAAGEEEARAVLEGLTRRFPDATHHCWAWRLGAAARERSSDAGEPSGTAGIPILQVLRGAGLSDAMAVVVRWYGGTKLGKGGLARAYSAATREALAGLPLAARVPTVEVEIAVPYERVGAVKRLIHPPAVELVSEEYGERALLVLAVHEERREGLAAALADLGISPGSGAPSDPKRIK
jgi:uncharacterized YigZ family protein